VSSRPVFSLTGPLPSGRVAIEASAGTGKTYTLAGLVVRYVAEAEVPLEKLLIVTFTRAAASELRDRVRTRLAEAVVGLRDPVEAREDDDLVAFLARTDRDRRLERLERAVLDFDAATITTIHGFAQQVLRTLGSAAPGDLDATLLDDTSELARSVCADVLAAESFTAPVIPDPLPTVGELLKISAKVLANPGISLVPDAGDETAPAAARLRRLVDRTVDEVRSRRRASGTLSFDDLLTQLRDALESEAATATLRRRFQVALIDEFQDTDPVQWDIFSKLFGIPGDNSTLVLVADPKQAIYAFRGANVHTYLEAAHIKGTERSTLGTNWRSDGAVLRALERVFRGATFGDPRIEFVPVEASPEHRLVRLSADDGSALPALRVRLALGEDLPRTGSGHVQVDAAQRAIARDLAQQVHELLDTAFLPPRASGEARRPVRPGDIAVLVGQHSESEIVQAALRESGIPAVTTRADSVLKSPAAAQWRWLLTALARPNDPTRARTASLTWFFGWTVAELDAADDMRLSEVQNQLGEWAETLADHGAVELCARVWAENIVSARVLATSDGDRNLTDLDHIAGLLQTATVGRRPTATGLLALMEQLEAEIADDPENDVTARQVESEAEAVQIMTIYVAKGLEFPVVCVPTMWRQSHAAAREVVFQDPVTGRRTFDIANGNGWPHTPDSTARRALADAEALGENLRLLYVAVTRAEHETLLWWTRAQKSEDTGLARVLFARTDGEIDPELFTETLTLPADSEAAARLEPAFAAAGDAVAVAVTGLAGGPVSKWVDRATPPPESSLELAALERVLDRANRRWSFSAIASRAQDAELDPTDESLGDFGAADEQAGIVGLAEVVLESTSAATSDLPLGEVPGGAQFGTLVHEVLERVDFTAVDLDSELRTQIDDRLRWNPWPVVSATLVAGLRAAIETPLGPLFDGRRLRDLARVDRLGELNFELRLGGRGRFATDRDIGELILGHLPEDDPLRAWAQRLASGLFTVELAGHLTGSIDVVARVGAKGDEKTEARFVVVDYKTNVLAELGHLPQATDYHPDHLPAAMAEHHYPLQALLYSVALHRYLRWRVPGYDPARHLGGAAYLFVRGMAGAATPVVKGNPHGVFSWRVPASLVTGLSDLLDGAEAKP
jgi:exodeoxyribonuclease V beta subunit